MVIYELKERDGWYRIDWELQTSFYSRCVCKSDITEDELLQGIKDGKIVLYPCTNKGMSNRTSLSKTDIDGYEQLGMKVYFVNTKDFERIKKIYEEDI